MSAADTALDLTSDTPGLRPHAAYRNAKTCTRADFTPTDWTVPVSDAVHNELHAIVA